MKLYYSPISPFVRKVMIVAREARVDDRIERIAADATGAHPGLAGDNPLDKIPCLVTDDGLALYDSPVIAEYLDATFNGGRLFPAAGYPRWQALTWQALGDGILDALVLCRYEGRRPPEKQDTEHWVPRQMGRVDSGLAALERQMDDFATEVTIGQVAVACMLGYLELRFPDLAWRAARPKLAAWYDDFAKRPSLAATAPAEA